MPFFRNGRRNRFGTPQVDMEKYPMPPTVAPCKRKFEKVSFEQFYKDMKKFLGGEAEESEIQKLYDLIKLPRRATTYSAGYDFFSPIQFRLPADKTIKIPTGIKALCCRNEFLSIHVRSSTGFKYNVNLLNSTGIVDHDFANNPDNEGHIWMGFKNHGENEWKVNQGEAFGQGIFMKYAITDDDSPKSDERVGGFGSSGK